MRTRQILSLCAVLTCLWGFASAAVVDVVADFNAVQAAIGASSDGDTIRIAPGTITAPAAVAVSGKQRDNTQTCTLTVPAGHGLVPGEGVIVALSAADANFDGWFIITSVTATTITYNKVTAATLVFTACGGTVQPVLGAAKTGQSDLTIMGQDPNNKPVIFNLPTKTAGVMWLNPVCTNLTLKNLVFRMDPTTPAGASGSLGVLLVLAPPYDGDIEKFIGFTMDNCEIDGSNIYYYSGMNGLGRAVGGNTYYTWAGTFTIQNSKIYNINDRLVVDATGGGGGYREFVTPVTVFTFNNNECFNCGGAVGIRAKWTANTVVNIYDNYMHDYHQAQASGGGGVFKFFFPRFVNVERNRFENIPFLQGALGDEASAQGGALLLEDRRVLGDPPGTDPTVVNIRNNTFINCLQAIWFDTFNITGRSKCPYIPAGVIEDNFMDGCTWGLMCKRDSQLDDTQTTAQLAVRNNTIINTVIADVYIRTGFLANGETITFEGNFYGDRNGDGLYNEADASFTADADVVGGAPVTASGTVNQPILMDRDGDGLLNSFEEENGLNPDNPDSDGDGYQDGTEVRLGSVAMAKDPNSHPVTPYYSPIVDTDSDGYSDAYEVDNGTDPLSAASHPTLADVNEDNSVDNVDAVIVYAGSLQQVNLWSYPLDRMDVNFDKVINNLEDRKSVV